MAMGMHLTSMFLLCVLTSVSSVEVERNDTAILSGDMENKVGVGTTNYVATDVTSGPNRFRLKYKTSNPRGGRFGGAAEDGVCSVECRVCSALCKVLGYTVLTAYSV